MKFSDLPYDVCHVIIKYVDRKELISFYGINKGLNSRISEMLKLYRYEYIIKRFPKRYGLNDDCLKYLERKGNEKYKYIIIFDAMKLGLTYKYVYTKDIDIEIFKWLETLTKQIKVPYELREFINFQRNEWTTMYDSIEGVYTMLEKEKCGSNSPVAYKTGNSFLEEMLWYRRYKKYMMKYNGTWCVMNYFEDVIYQNISLNYMRNPVIFHQIPKIRMIGSGSCLYFENPLCYEFKCIMVSHAIKCNTNDMDNRLKEIRERRESIVTYGDR